MDFFLLGVILSVSNDVYVNLTNACCLNTSQFEAILLLEWVFSVRGVS